MPRPHRRRGRRSSATSATTSRDGGKGFVLALSKRWDEPEAADRAWYASGRDDEFRLGAVQFVQVEQYIWVANLIGQRGTNQLRLVATVPQPRVPQPRRPMVVVNPDVAGPHPSVRGLSPLQIIDVRVK